MVTNRFAVTTNLHYISIHTTAKVVTLSMVGRTMCIFISIHTTAKVVTS